MPTLLAIISASIAGFLTYKHLQGLSVVLGFLVSLFLWCIVYYFIKKTLKDLKP